MPPERGHELPAWGRRLIAEFNAADERAAAVAKTLTPRQLNWRRRPGEWSVGQCLEHLRVANEVYVHAISTSLAGRPPAMVENITPGWFGRWFIRNYIEPSGDSRRARAPKTIRPGGQVDVSILDQFLRSNDQARELVRRARNYNVNHVRFRNPFIPMVRFTVGTGLVILSTHESRHLLQAERVRAFSEFPER